MHVEDEIRAKFRSIFGLPKVSFDMPDDVDSREQDTLFVQIKNNRSRLGVGTISGTTTGDIRVYSQNQKIPVGFFARQIELAKPELTRPFFFFNLEGRAQHYQNISEISASFIFFYSAQNNPNRGELNEVDFPEGES